MLNVEVDGAVSFYLWNKGDYNAPCHTLDIHCDEGLIEIFLNDKELEMLKDALR